MKIEKNQKDLENKFSKKISSIAYSFKNMSFARHILLFYIIITIFGALLLWAPFSQTGNIEWDETTGKLTPGRLNFVDSLFTAASAFSDTGLVTNTTSVVFTEIGQAVIAVLIFVGGIGWFALKVFIFNIIFGKPMSFKARQSLAAERGSSKVGVTRDLIKVAVVTLFIITLIFSVVLSIIFYYTDISGNSTAINGTTLTNDKLLFDSPYHSPMTSIKYGVFHTISALNNAGFDIMSNSSLGPYYYTISVQVIFIILFVIGGMGYPVIYDVYTYLKSKSFKRRFRFSLFTKLSVSTYFIIAAMGLGVAFLIETQSSESFWNSSNANYGSKSYKSLAVIFNTMSTRNAGFSTISLHDVSRGTLVLYIVMMFIGSAPSSTAGGIRTTTFAIVILSIYSLLRGKRNLYIFGRMIKKETVNQSFIVFVFSIGLIVVGTLITMTSLDVFGGKIPTANHVISKGQPITSRSQFYNFTEVFFEVGSAFGTTGLSVGITKSLSLAGKLTLILIMFIGQLGVSSSILVWGNKRSADSHYSRVTDDVSIG